MGLAVIKLTGAKIMLRPGGLEKSCLQGRKQEWVAELELTYALSQ